MRRLALFLLAATLTLSAVAFVPSGEQAAAGERYCPPGVNYCAENAFLAFWKTNGNLEILGLPVSQPFVDDRGLIVQFYERAILEWHPENEAKYQVLLTRLGSDLLGDRPERTAAVNPCPSGAADCTVVETTNHSLRGVFLKYWQSNGGLAVFGFPLTEEFTETNAADGKPYTVQYFERNRFEYHPEQETRYQVLLGLLGAESLSTQRAVLDRPTAQVPDYTKSPVTVGQPVTLDIPTIGVNAPVEQVGVNAEGNMDTPKNPNNTAWYAPGPRPGQPGNAVISGHVDYHGIGPVVFWKLNTLVVGDEVFVTDDQGQRRRFTVASIAIYPANDAPRALVFGPTTDTNLNLISCTGDFDPGSASYNNRIVVYTKWDGVTP